MPAERAAVTADRLVTSKGGRNSVEGEALRLLGEPVTIKISYRLSSNPRSPVATILVTVAAYADYHTLLSVAIQYSRRPLLDIGWLRGAKFLRCRENKSAE